MPAAPKHAKRAEAGRAGVEFPLGARGIVGQDWQDEKTAER
jgi:hypothetical protein